MRAVGGSSRHAFRYERAAWVGLKRLTGHGAAIYTTTAADKLVPGTLRGAGRGGLP
jgi:hypothetical protein